MEPLYQRVIFAPIFQQTEKIFQLRRCNQVIPGCLVDRTIPSTMAALTVVAVGVGSLVGVLSFQLSDRMVMESAINPAGQH